MNIHDSIVGIHNSVMPDIWYSWFLIISINFSITDIFYTYIRICMINGFIHFYISMSVVARPICKFVIWETVSSIGNSVFWFNYLELISQGIFLFQSIHHTLLRHSNQTVWFTDVYQEWINSFISVLFGDRNIGIAYRVGQWVTRLHEIWAGWFHPVAVPM